MNKRINKALDELESGRWNVQRAVEAIKACGGGRGAGRARWLHVRVVEGGRKKISLRLPFGVLSVMSAALKPFIGWAARRLKARRPGFSGLNIESLDLRRALLVLRDCGPQTVVEVKERDIEVLIKTT